MGYRPVLIGREDEVERVERFIAGDGHAVLLIEGPAGIGKTSLWTWGIERAREKGIEILRARPAREEAEFSYSALADLFDGIAPDDLRALTAAQREAIDLALLRSDRGLPSRPEIAAAVTEVVSRMASRDAIIIAVDDVPWLDVPSAGVFRSIARNVGAVRFLLSATSGIHSDFVAAFPASRLERIVVRPLTMKEQSRMLAARLNATLPRRVAQAVYVASMGNPQRAIELAREAAETDPRPVGDGLPLPVTIKHDLIERIDALDPGVRRLLLAVTLARGLRVGDISDRSAIELAVTEGILSIEGDRISPADALLTAAMRALARPSERRALSKELSESIGDDVARAFLLALSGDGPSEEVASAVASGAATALQRGHCGDAAELAEHAFRLTPFASPPLLRRALASVGYLWCAGDLDRARALLAPVLSTLPPGELLVAGLVLADVLGMAMTSTPAKSWVVAALDASAGDPVASALATAHERRVRTVKGARSLDVEESFPASADARGPNLSPCVAQLELSQHTWVRAMRGLPVDDLVVRASRAAWAPLPLHVSPGRVAALRECWRGDVAIGRASLEMVRVAAEERGESESFAIARLELCALELRAGHFDAAAILLEEWSFESDALALGGYLRCRGLLEAAHGDLGAAFRSIDEAIELANRADDDWQRLDAFHASGLAWLLAEDPVRASSNLRIVWQHTCDHGIRDPGVFPVGPDLVEALTMIGELVEARAVADRLDELATELDHPWARTAVLRCRGLLRPHTPESVPRLESAVQEYGRLGLLFDRARTMTLLGRVCSDQNQMEAGRGWLRGAADAFEELGGPGWGARPLAALANLEGSKTRDRQLTSGELRVARLVAAGQRNREVAEALSVTVKTVETHLSHIYTKLDVRSRTELAIWLRNHGW